MTAVVARVCLLAIVATIIVRPAAAQEAAETAVYPLPKTWQGDATVDQTGLADAAPPLQVIAANGDFRITYLPVDGSDVIRILPKGNQPGAELLVAWSIPTNSDDPALTPGSTFVLGASARAFSRPDGVMLTIREFDGENWASSSVPMQDVSWADYSVARQVGEDAVEVQVGLQWKLPNDNAWLEFREMELAVLPATDAAQIELSPEDTPTPISTPTPTAQPTQSAQAEAEPSSDNLIVVTSTPTPASLFSAATQVAQATESALKLGTATPTPENMVTATPTPTALMVTNTPTPANPATATYHAAVATAMAATTGTPTPLPTDARVVIVLPTPTHTPKPKAIPPTPAPTATRTPTPIAVPYDQIKILTSTPTPEFPPELVGKILFLSTHLAKNPRNPNAFMINPDGSGLALMKSRHFYDRAKARDAYSADRRFHAYSIREPLGGRSARIQVFYDDAEYASTHHQLTYFGHGTAWAPSWSPRQEAIALVSSDTNNDEIWLVRRNKWPPLQLTKNEWEWDRSPSYSPDGTQIAYESNRDTGTRQLWMMDVSGQNQRQITNFDFEVWNPVWVKYTDD